ncbi:hypothetical protein DFQ29_005232 [Apophysomyces sp. BC1021]|nr:hypothetical protein DFQ29_005232 [Apophysomyces sp. BC1021]
MSDPTSTSSNNRPLPTLHTPQTAKKPLAVREELALWRQDLARQRQARLRQMQQAHSSEQWRSTGSLRTTIYVLKL